MMKISVLLLSLMMAPCALAADSGKAADCVHWKAEARYQGLGYNHYVHLENKCKKAMRCEVKTNVNPDAQKVDIEPQKKKSVTTFIGSPASKFEARVTCQPLSQK